MPDSRVEKVRQRWFTAEWLDAAPGAADAVAAAAARMVSEIEQADLGVFDPADEVLHHMLGRWLQQRGSSSMPDEFAQDVARDLLAWLKDASVQ